MNIAKSVLITTVLSVFTVPFNALGNDGFEGTTELDNALRKFYQSVNGKEIKIDGAIGSLFGDQLYFVDGSGKYKIELDAGRDVRRKIEGCEIELFYATQSPCQIVGMVELAIAAEDEDAGDGFEIGMILYSVELFQNKDE